MTKIILPESDDELLALCRVETFRSSGPGGQHVNKTDSAVRLILSSHNIVVTCQEERSQLRNKILCLKKLREKVSLLNYRKPRRIPTKISYTKKIKNLEKKSKHGAKKQLRGKITFDD